MHGAVQKRAQQRSRLTGLLEGFRLLQQDSGLSLKRANVLESSSPEVQTAHAVCQVREMAPAEVSPEFGERRAHLRRLGVPNEHRHV